MEINQGIQENKELFELVDKLKTEIEKLTNYKEAIKKTGMGPVPSILRQITIRINHSKRRFKLINEIIEEEIEITRGLTDALINEALEELDYIKFYYDTDLGIIEKNGVEAYCLQKDEILTNAEQVGEYLAYKIYIFVRANNLELQKDHLIKLKGEFTKDVQSGFMRISHELFKEAINYCDLYDILEIKKQEKLFNEVNKILGIINEK